MRTYKLVRNTTGVLAGLLAMAYLVAVSIAAGDGQGGIEVQSPLNGIAIGLIIVVTLLSVGAWTADHANRAAAETYIRPLIRTELEMARAAWCRQIADDVAACLTELQDSDARRIARSVAHLTVAGVREVVADEVEDAMQQVLAAGRRYGAVMEASQPGGRFASTGTDHGIGGKGRGTVVQLPRQQPDRNTDND